MGDFGENAIEYIRRKKSGTYSVVENVARKAEGDMRMNFPWKPRTHTAHRALHAGVEESKDNVIMYLSHGVRYGAILEEGSKPHIIRPKNKKALYWHGAKHPVKSVQHPGTRPYPIVRPTAEKYKIKLRDAVLKWWGIER